jgi:chloramphenicol O-acetyltransferase
MLQSTARPPSPPPPADISAKISIKLVDRDVSVGMSEMDGQLAEWEENTDFYLALHAKYQSNETITVLTTELGDDLQHHYMQLANQLEEKEQQGWILEDFLQLNLHTQLKMQVEH